ncbi:MAG: chemotaxis protein CheB [Planctomycetota bacterium]
MHDQEDTAVAPASPNSLDGVKDDFFVVGIGASAGGLEALEQFFDNMPKTLDLAFVVVQHLSPDFKSLMDELLARHTTMPIHRVEDGMEVERGGIYLIPPKKNMALSDGRLMLTDQDTSGGLNLPIDLFFRSLAQDLGPKGIAVVLSGTGSDGSRGIRDVYSAGGLVLAQSIESAGFDGMPKNAIATGICHRVMDSTHLPEFINEYIKDPNAVLSRDATLDEPVKPGGELSAIFSLFRGRFGLDFSEYREGTIRRRIERRMQLIRCNRMIDYVDKIRIDANELEILYRDLLVEVTQFFRDPQAFDRLRSEVVPAIFDHPERNPEDEIRIWVAGCATGEEAYSIAILFHEEATRRNVLPYIKVFATDVHRSSLEIASAGVYPSDAIESVPEQSRQRYFLNHGAVHQVSPELRKLVIFAPQNMVNDPPFTRIDLITCRNVLIYLKPEVQKRVLSLFHFGLHAKGFLFLGSSESVGDLSRELETVDQHWRIYQKVRDVRIRAPGQSVPLAAPMLTSIRASNIQPLIAPGAAETETRVMEDLLDRYVPPSFLVNRHYELVHSFGDARRILMQPKGRPSLELLKLVEGDLRMAISTALHRCAREGTKVVLEGVRMASEGSEIAQVSVEPHGTTEDGLYLICIEPMETSPEPLTPGEQFRADDHAAQRIVDLERELEFKKESLQTTVEELESSNEELQSTNEELVAANEELQSTNEELHSVNEELYTVNAEHQRKIDELTHLTADMNNLIRSTDIGTVFLDRALRIRRFTPAISSAFDILEQDIGRPIDQFAYRFDNPDLIDQAKRVIETGDPFEEEIRIRDGNQVYLKRMLPYQAADGGIDGVVITFTDISKVVQARQQSLERREHLERVTRDLQDFIYAVSHDLQAPLRQVQSALTGFVENAPEELAGLCAQAAGPVAHRVANMETVLRCLLEHSRVESRGKPRVETDLNEVFQNVLERHRPLIEKTGARIRAETLPSVIGDAEQLERVFWHLIDNAIKYTRARTPDIQMTVEHVGQMVRIHVQDNGIGIQPQHRHEIFIIFKRLEFMEEVDGDGFGLSLCSRILDRHNGRISVDSNAGHGSTFSVEFESA